jgi:hypothetical protein
MNCKVKMKSSHLVHAVPRWLAQYEQWAFRITGLLARRGTAHVVV